MCQLACQLVTVVVDNRYRQISAVVLLVSAITHPEFEKKRKKRFFVVELFVMVEFFR